VAVRMLVLTLALGLVAGVIGSDAVTAQQPGLKLVEILKRDLIGSPGKEVIIAHIELAPGADTGKHYHPGDTFAYVLEGSLTSFDEGKPPITVKAGEILVEAPKVPHVAKNTSTTAPTRLLAIYIHDKGQPRAVREK